MGMANVFTPKSPLDIVAVRRAALQIQRELSTIRVSNARDVKQEALDYRAACIQRMSALKELGIIAGSRVGYTMIAQAFGVTKDGTIEVVWRHVNGGVSHVIPCLIPKKKRNSRRLARVHVRKNVIGSILQDIAINPITPAAVDYLHFTAVINHDGDANWEYHDGDA